MPTTVSQYHINDLAKAEDKNSIYLGTLNKTEIKISAEFGKTRISFPFGNRFDIIDGTIIIYDK